MPDMSCSAPARWWRDDIDSLAFRPTGHGGICVVHRLAFRTLLGTAAATPACLAYFDACSDLFQRAAADKIARRGLAADGVFHLNSRDIRRSG